MIWEKSPWAGFVARNADVEMFEFYIERGSTAHYKNIAPLALQSGTLQFWYKVYTYKGTQKLQACDIRP